MTPHDCETLGFLTLTTAVVVGIVAFVKWVHEAGEDVSPEVHKQLSQRFPGPDDPEVLEKAGRSYKGIMNQWHAYPFDRPGSSGDAPPPIKVNGMGVCGTCNARGAIICTACGGEGMIHDKRA